MIQYSPKKLEMFGGEKPYFNFVSLDCTSGITETGRSYGFQRCVEVKSRLKEFILREIYGFFYQPFFFPITGSWFMMNGT